MKTLHSYLFTFILLFMAYAEAQAQFGGGGLGGRQRNPIPQTTTQEPPKPLTADEMVDNQMPKISEALGLNPFEVAVLRTTLVKYVQKSIELQILNLPADKTREAMEKIIKEQEEELKANLTEEQYQAFMDLQKDGFKSKKKKKDKKKKSKTDEEQ